MNSIPLTEVNDDVTNIPLTPNDFITMKGVSLPPGLFEKTDSSYKKKWKQIQYLAHTFCQKWEISIHAATSSTARVERKQRTSKKGRFGTSN